MTDEVPTVKEPKLNAPEAVRVALKAEVNPNDPPVVNEPVVAVNIASLSVVDFVHPVGAEVC